ncbi:MAG: N-acetyl-gamma-glutamyl-phosphate reductase [Anaerolineales bacterium]|nr:N-acetyl-gamma-glutamyl-phosphate reductase [Anaerolineales bacterium]
MTRVSIVGGSGYTGGELLRLLIAHPEVEVVQVTSRSRLGEFVYQTHPNLRKRTTLKFSSPEQLEPVDVLFLALPHGQAQTKIEHYAALAPNIVDLSADFRLRDAAVYQKWYGSPHAAPEWMNKFVYGLPELHRAEMAGANYISGVGCNATASNLALLPLVNAVGDNRADLIETASPIIIEIKVGSSEGGAEGNPGSHHPERSSVIRTFSPFGHRHTAEVMQELGLPNVSLTMTSVDIVRGVLATAHATVKPGVTTKDLWKAYRAVANENPFIRIVKEQRGIYRVPEPKILAGSNYADLGFELDESNGHVVAMCAIDNLMKGASGSAVQCMNLMLGLDETTGLEFMGLHPI